MKSHLLPVLLFSLLASPVFSQRTLKDIDENKYRINLPDHWKAKSKAFQVLSEVLPGLCPELKDKDICGDDCNPAWTVELYISEPELVYFETRSWPATQTNASTNTQNAIVRRELNISPGAPQPAQYNNNLTNRQLNRIDTRKEIISYYNFQCFLLLADREKNIVTRLILVDTNEVWARSQPNKKTFTAPGSSSKTSPLLPEPEELLAIADKKILALGKGE